MAAGHQSPPTNTRSVERSLEEAQSTGCVDLSHRKLNEYPKSAENYDLVDTVEANLSKNRLIELPKSVCQYVLMEKLNCYHNAIRSLPQAIVRLQCLTYLDLSRNQLSHLPAYTCQLAALEVLLISNNRLVSLPEEIGQLPRLMEVDISCNEVTTIPEQIGELNSLKTLNLRKNLLVELPPEISKLKLKSLNFSCNKIQAIPLEYRLMDSLEELILDNNPLISPPAHTCTKGRVHTMKYLHNMAAKEDKRRGVLDNNLRRDGIRRSFQRDELDAAKSRRRAIVSVDSGFSETSNRWSSQIENGGDGLAIKAAESMKEQRQERHIELQKRISQAELHSPGKPPPHHVISRPTPTMPEEGGSISPLKTTPGDQQGISDMFAKISNTLDLQYDPQELHRQKQDYDQKKRRAEQMKIESQARRSPVTSQSHPPNLQSQNSSSSLRSTPTRDSTTPPRTNSTTQPRELYAVRPHSLEVSGYYSSQPMHQSPPAYVCHSSEFKGQYGQGAPLYQSRLTHTQPYQQQPGFYDSLAATDGMSDQRLNSQVRNGREGQPADRRSPNELSSDSHRSSPTSLSSQESAPVVTLRNPRSETNGSKKSAKEKVTSFVSMNSSPGSRESHSEVSKTTSQLPMAKGKRITVTRGRSKTAPLSQQDSTKRLPVRASISTATAKQSSISKIATTTPPVTGSSKTSASSSSAHKFGFQSPKPSRNSLGKGQDSHRSRASTGEGRSQDHTAAVASLRENIESRLKVTLQDDVGAALRDGVVLCHLANHIKPRTVSQIHVPSTAVPKLSMAKCKRNVENFLDACRRLGLSQEQLCSQQDILEEKNAKLLSITVQALIDLKNRPSTGTSRVSTPRSSTGSRSSLSSGQKTPTSSRRTTTPLHSVV